jgi:hypothetical protein
MHKIEIKEASPDGLVRFADMRPGEFGQIRTSEYRPHIGLIVFRLPDCVVDLNSGDVWSGLPMEQGPRVRILSPGTQIAITVGSVVL